TEIFIKRCEHSAKITAGNDAVIPETWGEPACRLFANICANADSDCDVSCHYADAGSTGAYLSVVSIGKLGLYFAAACRWCNVSAAKTDDGRKSGCPKSANDGDALRNAHYDCS